MDLLKAFFLTLGPLVLFMVAIAAVIAFLKGDLRGFLSRLLADPKAARRAQRRAAQSQPAPQAESIFDEPQPRYRRRASLLTRGEQPFLPVLESILLDLAQHLKTNPLRVYVKVNLADLIEPDVPPAERSAATKLRNKIDRKHIDFAIVDATTFVPLCIVELDDRSHRAAKAQQRDGDKDAALASAGVPVCRIEWAQAYDRRTVGRSIAAAIAPS